MMNDAGLMPMEAPIGRSDEAVFSKREKFFSFGAAVLGSVFVKCFAAPFMINARMGLGAAVFLILALVFALTFKKGRKITPSKALRIVLCVLFSANIFISANLLIQSLGFIFAAMILVYDCLADSDERFDRIRKLFPADIFAAAFRPLSDMGACPGAMKSAADKNKAGKAVKNALLGLAIALPSTMIVGILLMSADSGFADILSSITDGGLRSVMIFAVQTVIGLPVGFYIFAMCHAPGDCDESSDEYCLQRIAAVRFVPSGAAAFSAVPLCVMYVIFFFSQISYFLSSFASRLPSDMESYSEYARRGFFELCIVALINLAVIIGINLFSKYGEDGKKSEFLKIMTVTLCIFTILLIVTAVSKMGMYISVYGLTRLRFYTTWFMLLLGVLFIGIIISVVCGRFNLSKFAVTAFTVMFAVLSFSNADRLIAEYNIGRYLDGTLPSADITMFRELSADAVPAAEKLRGHISPKEEEVLDEILESKSREFHNADIRTVTVSELTAERVSDERQ
ncbi:MAG: DUF4153 domain-containing protein [Huintestinicola sp.]|uniref:DUF4153 domain-containing protein n=1 Tax=Huintestinicola sp. TaxID=2981661 RepID=UPI003F0419D3